MPPPHVQQDDRQLQFSYPEVANGKFYAGRPLWSTHTPLSQLRIKVPLIAGQPSTLQQQAHQQHQQQQQQYQYDTPQPQAHQQQAAHVTQAKPEEDDDDDFDIQLDIPQPAAQLRPEADDVSTKPCKQLYSLCNSTGSVLHSRQ